MPKTHFSPILLVETSLLMSKINFKSGLLFAALGVAVFLFSVDIQKAEAAFPGTNGKIAFVSDRGGNFGIYTMNPDGSGIVRLTASDGYDFEPAWSSDGSKIAFTRIQSAQNTQDIYVMNASGGNQVSLTNNTSNWDDRYPAWSPDGTKIAFSSNRKGNYEIYTMSSDGSNVLRLTNTPTFENGEPAWSPNGNKIAFYTLRDGNAEVYLMNADGSNQMNLTNTSAYGEHHPAWSPDGSKIAFSKKTAAGGEVNIYVMNADGNGVMNLAVPASDHEPAWSPDGAKIVFSFSSSLNFPMDVFVMNADGSNAVDITDNGAWDGQPDWQPITGAVIPPPLTLAEKAVEQAHKVVTGLYTFGAKGWNTAIGKYVSSNTIKTGTPYTYWKCFEYDGEGNCIRAGNDPNGRGVDCSGLVQWSYNTAFGATKELKGNPVYNWGANGMYTKNIEKIEEKDLKSGDLMFFETDSSHAGLDHVAMYVGPFTHTDGKVYDVIEAYSPDKGIIPSVKDRRKTTNLEGKASGWTKDFGRITAPKIDFKAQVYSPVDLIVTDPDGYTITPETVIVTDHEILREVPQQLYYMHDGADSAGNPEAVVVGQKLKEGAYVIKVVPRANAALDDVYTLDTEINGTTTVLADNVPVSEIPSAGYGVLVGEESSIETFYPVSIDIKPDSSTNSINLGSRGNVPVVIFSDPDFDASEIDPLSISLAGAHIQIKGKGTPMTSVEDINNDGLQDLIVHIDTEGLRLNTDDTKATLRAMATDGRLVIGSDSVRIAP